jgi:ATP-dependent Lhr-like helicase
MLRSVRKSDRTGEVVRISGADPLNLVGIVLPGPRIPAVPTNSLTYLDGVPATTPSATVEGEPAPIAT